MSGTLVSFALIGFFYMREDEFNLWELWSGPIASRAFLSITLHLLIVYINWDRVLEELK